MEKNMPEYYDSSVEREGILETGNAVGDLAMGYFGEYCEVPYSEDRSAMLSKTQELLATGVTTIAEASFAYNGNFCSVDILRVFDGYVEIIEVKSGTGIKEQYYDDMAYQCWLLEKCGLTVRSVSLMHIDNSYVRHGMLELDKLFIVKDCTDRVLPMLDDVERNIDEIKAYADAKEEMPVDIGEYCDKPYECGYKKWCWRAIPDANVFQLQGRLKKHDLYRRGIVTMKDALRSKTKLSEAQRTQAEFATQQLPPKIQRKEIRQFLDLLTYPLYFLDFESYMPAVPEFDGTRPYMQIPFQYSLHIKASEFELEHREFLAKEGTDPRRAIAERLCSDIPDSVCTVAYNMSFEKTRLRELAEAFPDLAPHLLRISENMYDLMIPFKEQWYYCRDFEGSYSIKKVLPAMCPDDPELDYHALNGIQNGSEAMNAFPALASRPRDEIEQVRQSLLQYCRLDTLAMVRIWEKLKEL